MLWNFRKSRLASAMKASLLAGGLTVGGLVGGATGIVYGQAPAAYSAQYTQEAGSTDDGIMPVSALRSYLMGRRNNCTDSCAEGGGECAENTANLALPCCQGEFWSINSLFDDGCGGNRLTDNGWSMGGVFAQSMTFNADNPKDKFNGPVTWTDRANEYQLNQASIYLQKAVEEPECEDDIAVGGRVELLYGTNARFTTQTGLEDNINGGQAFYGLALFQFYAETAYKGWRIKSGHWVSRVGYFTVDTSQNFFNTIPYTYQYGEPFTHTGSIVSRQVNDNLNVGLGVIRGWDNFDNTNHNLGVILTGNWTIDDKSSLAYVGVISQEPNQALISTQRYLQTLVYTRSLTDYWTYVAQSDFGYQNNAIAANGRDAKWYGFNQFWFYRINDCWSWGFNAEWFRDEEGFRVGGFLPNAAVPGSLTRGLSIARYGYVGNFYQITFGPKWTPTKNIMIRPNVRYDWFQGDIDTGVNPGKLRPYGDGLKNSQAIFSTDLVLTF